jgi:molybdenum cofactor guanylyltransferase
MEASIIILAGGLSSRMGEDKGLMQFQGKRMIEHILDRVSELNLPILIVSNDSRYNQFNYPCFKDEFKGQGPLAGLYTGLKESQTLFNLVLSCDIPFVDLEVLITLLNFNNQSNIVLTKYKEKTHHLIGRYSKTLLPEIKKELEKEQLKLQYFNQNQNAEIIDFSNHPEIESKCFSNLNSHKDILDCIEKHSILSLQ